MRSFYILPFLLFYFFPFQIAFSLTLPHSGLKFIDLLGVLLLPEATPCKGFGLFRDIRIPGFAPRSMDTLLIKGRALIDRCIWNPGVILSCDVEGGYHHALLH